jgi:penicillin-binding protein 1A
MVGGRDQTQSTFDRALYGRRQMGSSFKPFVYAEAIREGWTPADHLDDEPFTLVMSGGQTYQPHNYDNTYSGRVTVREALIKSLNVPTVRLANSVGTGDIAALAKSAGITEDIPQTPSMALGTVSASPMEVALAYTSFATLGTAVRQPRWVTSIYDEDGTEIFRQAPPHTEAVMDPALAYVVTDMLEDVVNRGTGTAVRSVGYRGVAAGKTGTTSAGRDVWFVGYTPELVGVIWMGLDEPSTILPGAAGGSLVAPVWGRAMARRAKVRRDPGEWPVPEGVVRMRVDPSTGTVLTRDCWVPNATDEVFLASNVPAAGCPEVWPRGFFDRTMGWLGAVFGGDEDQQKAQDRARETQQRVQKEMERARERAEKPKGHGLGGKLKRLLGVGGG